MGMNHCNISIAVAWPRLPIYKKWTITKDMTFKLPTIFCALRRKQTTHKEKQKDAVCTKSDVERSNDG